jgi:hypothetical protein
MPLGFDVRNRPATLGVLLMHLIHISRRKASTPCNCGALHARNLPDKDEAPQMPDGFNTKVDKKDWRH